MTRSKLDKKRRSVASSQTVFHRPTVSGTAIGEEMLYGAFPKAQRSDKIFLLELRRTARMLELRELIAKISKSDRNAFGLLYERTRAELRGLIRQFLSEGDAAFDVLQEVYVLIWRKAHMFDPVRGAPMVWIKAITRNRCIQELRLRRRMAMNELSFENMKSETLEFAAEQIDPLSTRDNEEKLRALAMCLSELDIHSREMITLAYCSGMTREGLSRHFGVPVPTVKTRLRRGLAKLKTGLVESTAFN